MISNPRLYAVVSRTEPAPAHKEHIGQLRERKHAELHLKKATDRASAVLDRLEARQTQYKQQIAALQKRAAYAAARYARLEERILTLMQQARLDKADGFAVQFLAKVTPAAVDVYAEASLPAEFVREKLSVAPDKVALKAALAAGREIPGARLTQRLSLQRK